MRVHIFDAEHGERNLNVLAEINIWKKIQNLISAKYLFN